MDVEMEMLRLGLAVVTQNAPRVWSRTCRTKTTTLHRSGMFDQMVTDMRDWK